MISFLNSVSILSIKLKISSIICGVQQGSIKFKISSIICGVQQGPILISLLFLIYVNDMPMTVKCNLF